MKSDIIFFASDAINKYGYFIDIQAFEKLIKDVNKGGVPMLIAHDFHRPVGWSRPFGVFIKPGIAFMASSREIVENQSDQNLVITRVNHFLHDRYESSFLPIHDEFVKSLVSPVEEDSIKLDCGCAAIFEKDIVVHEFPDFFDKSVLDKSGLFPLSYILTEFEYHMQGVFKHKRRPLCVFAHEYFRRSQSRLNNLFFTFLDELMTLSGDPDVGIRIRLDLDLIGYAPSYKEIGELAYHYGPKYNDNIDQIKHGITRHQCSEFDRRFSGVASMEFYGKHDENEFTFEAEEIKDFPAAETDEHYACRYVHAIFDKQNKIFNHFDGAIRSYDFESLTTRVSQTFLEYGRKAEYLKLFRIDGKLPIDKWKTLVTHFYQENPLIYEYFEIDVSGLKSNFREKPLIKELLPYEIEEEDGLRIFLSYHEIFHPINNGRYVDAFDVFSDDKGDCQFLEHNIFELKFSLAKLGEDLSMPGEIDFVKFDDNLWNIPSIMHAGENQNDLVAGTIKAMKNLFASMIDRGIYKTISLTLSYIIDGRIARISSFGSIGNQLDWLATFDSLPTTETALTEWVTCQRKYLDQYKWTEGNAMDEALLQHDGVLYMKRVQLLTGYEVIPDDKGGLSIRLSEPGLSAEIMKLALGRKVRPVIAVKIEKAIWSDNGADYFSSNKSKWMDEVTGNLAVIECTPLGVFWAHP